MTSRRTATILGLLAVATLVLETQPSGAQAQPSPGSGIEKVVVVVEQDHTFDSYFGTLPGVNGLEQAVPPLLQDGSGQRGSFKQYDERLMDGLRPASGESPLDSSAATAEAAGRDGNMDGLLAAQHAAKHQGDASLLLHTASSAGPLWSVAQQSVLFDNYFSAEPGGSLTNMLAMLTGSEVPLDDGSKASLDALADSKAETVFDRLGENGNSWKYYAGSVGDVDPAKVLDGSYQRPDETAPAAIYRTPLLGMRRFWTVPKLKAGIADQDAFYSDAAAGTLPDVAFVSPSPTDSLASNSAFAQARLLSVINAMTKSPDWPHTAVFVVWDDWGGYYDHVRPPEGDGFRVPMLLLSPWAQRGVVSSTQHDHLSILNFIVQRFGLASLTSRQASAQGFDDVLRTEPDPYRPVFSVQSLPKPPVGTLRANTLMRLLYGGGAAAALGFAWLARKHWTSETRQGWQIPKPPPTEFT